MPVRTLCRRLNVLAMGLACMCCWGCGLLSSPDDELVAAMRLGKTPEVRRQALLKLRDRARPAMREDLEIVLSRELDPSIRALAAQVLGELGDADAVAALRDSLRGDPSWVVRERALAALARLLGSEVGEDLEYVLEREPRPAVAVKALELAREHLAEKEPDRLLKLLMAALGDASPAVRLRADALLKELTGLSAAPDPVSWRKALDAEPSVKAEG